MRKETSYTLLLHFQGDLIEIFRLKNVCSHILKNSSKPKLSTHLFSFAELSELAFPFQLPQEHITLKFHCTTKPSPALPNEGFCFCFLLNSRLFQLSTCFNY